ncbi:MAG: RsmD family RNA methyltransferase, partial [Candidatus Omnitrophota bacterium]|nr:RsmD family RNA methyltransferase [Candidatus Omnitrophota bacterium]
LDLYCGSGAVGIEAFSRGAKKVTFVDNNLQCIKTVKKNVAGLGISDISSIEIYKRDALRAIEDFCSNHQRFDIVFLDPPYYKEIAKNTLIALSEYDILVRNALIVAEVFKKDELPERCAGFKKARSYRYGDTILVFFTPYLTRPVQ